MNIPDVDSGYLRFNLWLVCGTRLQDKSYDRNEPKPESWPTLLSQGGEIVKFFIKLWCLRFYLWLFFEEISWLPLKVCNFDSLTSLFTFTNISQDDIFVWKFQFLVVCLICIQFLIRPTASLVAETLCYKTPKETLPKHKSSYKMLFNSLLFQLEYHLSHMS